MLSLQSAIKALHARKDRAYRTAWKRRGERISVLPNIARKVDRLVVFAHAHTEIRDESLLDTGIDLLVYCGKYLLFLAEIDPALVPKLYMKQPKLPLSDHAENLDQLIDRVAFSGADQQRLADLILTIEDAFEVLWPLADVASTTAARFELAISLWEKAALVVGIIARERPKVLDQFLRDETAIAEKGAS